jgi:hypothetical protein
MPACVEAQGPRAPAAAARALRVKLAALGRIAGRDGHQHQRQRHVATLRTEFVQPSGESIGDGAAVDQRSIERVRPRRCRQFDHRDRHHPGRVGSNALRGETVATIEVGDRDDSRVEATRGIARRRHVGAATKVGMGQPLPVGDEHHQRDACHPTRRTAYERNDHQRRQRTDTGSLQDTRDPQCCQVGAVTAERVEHRHERERSSAQTHRATVARRCAGTTASCDPCRSRPCRSHPCSACRCRIRSTGPRCRPSLRPSPRHRTRRARRHPAGWHRSRLRRH